MRKIIDTLDRICGNRYFPLLFIPIAVCFLLLFSYTTSPLFLNDGFDSAVFKTMGLAILKGKIPYVDIFDHKGPVLYFINALGQWLIPGRFGIFLLQVMGLGIALLYMYKTARLFVSNALSFLVILLTLFVFGGVIEEGNQCEEWMMYFFTVAMYYALKYFVRRPTQPHPVKYSLLYGICFGMTFFIRPNDAVATMGGLMTGVTIWLVYKKEYKNAVLNALSFASGFLVVAIPVVSYFAYHHALAGLWYGLVEFNKGYSGGVMKILTSVIYSLKLSIAMIFVVLLAMAYNSGCKRVMVLLMPMLIFEYVLFGTNGFPHYYIALLPLFCLYFLFLVVLRNRSVAIAGAAVFLFGLIVYSQPIIKIARKSSMERAIPLAHGRAYRRIQSLYTESERLFSAIPDSERDSIWNYNLRWGGGGASLRSPFSILWHEGLVQCNLITFGYNMELRQKDDITRKKPLWVVLDEDGIGKDKDIEELDPYILCNYDLVAATDTTVCKIELYRRK